MKYKMWFWGLLLFLASLFFDKTIINYVAQNRVAEFSLLVVGIIILIWKRKYIYRYLIGFGIFAGILWLIKNIVQRPRPFSDLDITSLLLDKTGFSFPSGHAGFAFFSLAFIWKLLPRFKWVWLAVAVIISLARVYVGVHYLSDIIASALIGLFLGTLLAKHKSFIFKK